MSSIWFSLPQDGYGSLLLDNAKSNFYVTGNWYYNSYKINVNTISYTTNPIPKNAFGLAIDNNNNLYVSIVSSNRIWKYLIQNESPTLNNNNYFYKSRYYPTSLATDSTNIYAVSNVNSGNYTDSTNITTKIFQFSISNPNTVTDWPSEINSKKPFRILLNNNIMYVANYGGSITKVNINNLNDYTLNWCILPTSLVRALAIKDDYLYAVYQDSLSASTISQIRLSDGGINNLDYYNVDDANPFDLCFLDNYIFFLSSSYIYKIDFIPTPIPIPPVISNICFAENTPILTDQGYIPINKIFPNIHTIYNKKIVDITRTITNDHYLVCFDKNAIQENYPTEKTIISKDHKVFYNGKMIEAYKFINKFKNVYKLKYNGEILYNILMEDHRTVMVNNLVCETLDPENIIAKLNTSDFSDHEKTMIISKINEHVQKKNNTNLKQINYIDHLNI